MQPQVSPSPGRQPTPTIPITDASELRNRRRWSAAELLAAQFPPMQWAVDGMLPIGLSTICGRPKVGKSWLGLQAGHAVGTGGELFGRRAEHGRVLYMALEDSPERIARRLRTQGVPSDAAIDFWTLEWPGWKELEREMSTVAYRLVVIDTISRTLEGADQNDTAQMTAAYAKAQRVALDQATSIVLIDHHRKGATSDGGIDDVLGSTAKAAVCDAILQLYKGQSKHDARLTAIGRDVDGDVEMSVRFDTVSCTWRLESENGGPRKDSVKARVMAAIGEIAEQGELPTTTRISEQIAIDGSYVSRMLGELLDAGLVIRGEKVGREQPYYLASSREVKHVNDGPPQLTSLTPLTQLPSTVSGHAPS